MSGRRCVVQMSAAQMSVSCCVAQVSARCDARNGVAQISMRGLHQ